MLQLIIIAVILLFNVNFGNCEATSTKSFDYNITLPNNDVVKVNLIFEFISQESSPKKPTTTSGTSTKKGDTSTRTSGKPATEGDYDDSYEKFTEDDAVQLFQKNLLEKEQKNIGERLNSTEPFYRHFNLAYKSTAISVRCLYKSNYKKKTLEIQCSQYYETTIIERIKDNGEIEYIIVRKDPATLENVILNEDINNYTQTLHMTIN